METIKILARGVVKTEDLIRITKIHARGVTKKEKSDGRWKRLGGTLVFATEDKNEDGNYLLGFVAADGRYLIKSSLNCGEVRFEEEWRPCPLIGGKGWMLWLHTEDHNDALGKGVIASFEICEKIVDGVGGERFVRFGGATAPLKDDYPNFWIVMPSEAALTPIRNWATTNPKYMQKVLDFVCEGNADNPAWRDVKVNNSGAPLVWDFREYGRYAALMPIRG